LLTSLLLLLLLHHPLQIAGATMIMGDRLWHGLGNFLLREGIDLSFLLRCKQSMLQIGLGVQLRSMTRI